MTSKMDADSDLRDWILRRWPAALVLALAAWSVYRTMLNHDVAYYLLLARGLDAGRELYATFPDYGLPANAWLGLLSLRVSGALSLPLVETHQTVLFLLAATGAIAAGLILERLIGRETVAGRSAMPLTAALFMMYPGYEFGQRDYLFAVLVAPLALTVAGRHMGLRPGTGLSVCVAFLAIVGGSLKPQFALPLITLGAVELVLRRGRLREVAREVWVAGGGLIAYAALVHVLYPTYFTEVLPSAFAVYGSYSGSMNSSLFRHLVLTLAGTLLAVGLAAFLVRARRPARPRRWLAPAALWFLFGAALLAMFVLQRQGFIYHLLPFGLFVAVSIGIFGLLFLDRALGSASMRPTTLSAVLAVAIIAGAGTAVVPGSEMSRAQVLEDPLGRILRQLPGRTPVLILSTGVPPQSPLHAYADIRWTGAFGALTELSAIVQDRDAAAKHGRPRAPALVAAERDLRRRLLLSLAEPRPEMVFVDVSQRLRWFERYDRQFEILPFLMEDARFAAAWKAYEPSTEVPTLFGVTVKAYKRRGGAG